MPVNLKKLIQENIPYYREIRQKIHANPELRYEEHQTALLVKQELEKLGLTVKTGIGKTGVVAVLDSGKPGKTIALRADMDALPIEELSSLPYRSKNEGKMHACGHDGHTATLLATAHVLSLIKESLSGKIKFIFQPAEEGGAGAKAMIEDGVLADPKVDTIFGYHNFPGIPLGHVQAKAGCILYGNTEFVIEVQGKSGHAAIPELAINPIDIAAEIVTKIPPLVQELSEDEPIIITITRFNSGIPSTIIPEKSIFSGTLRAPCPKKSKHAQEKLMSLIETTTKARGATAKMEFQAFYPPTINPVQETEFVLKHAEQLLGKGSVQKMIDAIRFSEDFSFFLQEVPGCFFLIGNGESASCHNANYNFNDEILPTAVEMFCTLILESNK